MLVYAYLFALISGAVVLGASILLGAGDDGGVHDDGGGGLAHGGFDAFLLTFRSLRFWTFFAAFFGLTGLVLDVLGVWIVIGLPVAIIMGFLVGTGAMAAIRWLYSSPNAAVSSGDYVGRSARVLVPFGKGSRGRVRVELKGSSIDLMATTDEDITFPARQEVLVVEMDGTTARVARAGYGSSGRP